MDYFGIVIPSNHHFHGSVAVRNYSFFRVGDDPEVAQEEKSLTLMLAIAT